MASSAATSMLAQWCLTAWKVAIGRPNWTRTLAYSAACWVVSVAIPIASAANTALAVSVSSRARPRAAPRPPASSRTRAARRLWSRLAGTVTVTPPAARSTRATSSPTGTSSTSARWPLITTPASPGDGVAGERDVAAEGDRADHAAVGQAGQQPLGQPGRRGAGRHRVGLQGAGQDGARDHGRQVRAGGQLPPHLLGHDQRLRQARTRSRHGRPGCAARAGRGPPVRPRSPAAAPPRRRAGRGRRHGSGAWPGGRRRSARARGALR